ncbi:MAG: LPS export ABC transporter ATP-binding protein [Helicobacter sp.]|nr:LPS export ABC transporter ATP-binding protein [Helicobacter sp.]MBD5168073.1 LPS export ABC transporter ATP-binding protein [Helicobacter sp.]MDE5815897.1 LPS export ABC transporter ATP-binding protein [Helicobacter sp.]MDE7196695.1 LPS export ABC transporter ATP-binding protein [Helicobacter sp.]MDE7448086.1 LPS export ABC transporter ATP-binding protein [Helicobacter sp.]
MHMLRALRVSKQIKKTPIIKDISLEVKSGEVVGLLGPNGAGKTTTFYILCGILRASSGEIFFDDNEISRLPLHTRSLYGIGYLPQESSVFKELTVEENLMIAAEIALAPNERQERIEELLGAFNIEPIRMRKGISLSGGERRRVEIARALVKKPKFILLDEPFAGVDPLAVGDIQQIIEQLVSLRIGVLITDHNVREMLDVCHRAYVIKSGTLLAEGSSDEIGNNELVRKHYLGESFRL